MKRLLLTAAALGAGTTAAHAGALDRSGQSMAVLFEKGRYGELSFGSVSPTISGVGANPSPSPFAMSGDMAPGYVQFSGAYKADLNDRLSYALIYDQPFGADVDYPLGTGYFAQGATAKLRTNALTGVLKYTTDGNVSLYGGLRLQSLSASAVVPFVSNWSATTSRDWALGYVLGAAYEKPEIALRISLTYNSKVKNKLPTMETSSGLGGPNASTTDITTPQSLNLEFQSGVAKDTLVFGSVRWVDWSNFAINPADYVLLTSGVPLVSYERDMVTYTLGVGRKLSDTWSVAASFTYEPHQGYFFGNLGPADGRKSITLAAIRTQGNTKITAGISYTMIGDAQTVAGPYAPAGVFTGNSAIAAGVKVGFTF